MQPDPDQNDPDKLKEESRESIEKVRKMVEEHEKTMPKDTAEPPLFLPED